MRECIEAIKKLIKQQVDHNRVFLSGKKFSEYQKTYFWTNENIGAYLELCNFEGKECALSVTASGDHTFNLITKGITDIDTFDTNKFTEYFAFGLKKALILKYNYEDFCLISSKIRDPFISLEELTEILSGLLPFMDLQYRIFWRTIIDYNYRLQKESGTCLNLMLMLSLEKSGSLTELHKFFNNYAKNPVSYELLKSRLYTANITFTHANASELPQIFSNKYDVILLSNIIDYFDKVWGKEWGYAEFRQYADEMSRMLSPDGVVFLHYILGLLKDGYRQRKYIANASTLSFEDLTDECFALLPGYNSITNGIIFKRTKNF